MAGFVGQTLEETVAAVALSVVKWDLVSTL